MSAFLCSGEREGLRDTKGIVEVEGSSNEI